LTSFEVIPNWRLGMGGIPDPIRALKLKLEKSRIRKAWIRSP
jgi:hypothetical protein